MICKGGLPVACLGIGIPLAATPLVVLVLFEPRLDGGTAVESGELADVDVDWFSGWIDEKLGDMV
jgi:hypothetical protein